MRRKTRSKVRVKRAPLRDARRASMRPQPSRSKNAGGGDKPAKRRSAHEIRTSGRDARRLEKQLDRISTHYRKAQLLAGELLTGINQLGRAAVARRNIELVHELVTRELLRDLLAFRDALEQPSDDLLVREMRRLRLLPDALLAWLAFGFALEPKLRRGHVIKVPSSRLGRFELTDDVPVPASALVTLEVTDGGWELDGQPLIPPRVTLKPNGTDGTTGVVH